MSFLHLRNIAIAIALLTFASNPLQAKTLSWAGTTDPETMDPHARASAPVISFLNNIYEGLVRRGPDMQLEPSLATRWEPLPRGTGWRFFLRRGVVFHNGNKFDADDVIFSYQRASSKNSDIKAFFAPVSRVIKLSDYVVDVLTKAPNPIFPDSIANFLIMDSEWSNEVGATEPARDKENFATRNANGTGPFRLASRNPGVKTTLSANDAWWDDREHNVDTAHYTPIGNSATGLAALLSREIDFISPIPLQNASQVEARDGFKVLEGIETRVIMFGFGHKKPTLDYSDEAHSDNPLHNVKVRRAIAQAIDVDTIDRVIMRGKAEPASQLIPAGLSGYSVANDSRPNFNVSAAKRALAEAGYPEGFSFGLMCPNDRYVNDEAVCRAAASMLAKVGVNAKVNSMPVKNYWKELRAGNFDMYMLGWSPGTFDAEHPIRFLVHTPVGKLGSWNFGGYSNARIDELLPSIQQEINPAIRQAQIDEVVSIMQDQVAYVPLYTQPLIWAMKDNIDVVQRPDNFFLLRWVNIN